MILERGTFVKLGKDISKAPVSIPNLHNVNNTSMAGWKDGWKAKLPPYTRSLRKRIHE